MHELTFREAVQWSSEVGDPTVIQPDDAGWNAMEGIIAMGAWSDIPGVRGPEPAIFFQVPPPREEELDFAPITSDIIQDLDLYNHKSPPGSQLLEEGSNFGDELDWDYE